MTPVRTWPNGYVSGWCLSPLLVEHGRCVLEHVADPDQAGCHCAGCRRATPLTFDEAGVVEVEIVDDAVEAFIGDPTSTGAAPSTAEPGAAPVTNMPALDEVREAGPDPATLARLEAVLELHSPAAPWPVKTSVRSSCAHCGRAHPCPTRQRALGVEAA